MAPLLLILVAVILSLVSLSLIVRSHRHLISWARWAFSWIALSHLRTQIRYADSDMRMCVVAVCSDRRGWAGSVLFGSVDLPVLRVRGIHIPGSFRSQFGDSCLGNVARCCAPCFI
ncbi:hypothetical protein EDB87DRAFT_1635018 [Lactarius vividus]|nr:hypothetical protein EDB87DRAFT_1635018 [Lactarius vividus]